MPAIAVMFIAVQIGKRRNAPLFDSEFHGPLFSHIDRPLVIGAALFGVGYGVSARRPTIALIAFLPNNLWIYLIALLVGSWLGGVIIPAVREPRLEPAGTAAE